MSAQERAERAREEACVIWIPGRLCLAAAKDPELSQHLSEQAFRNGLLPAKLPAPAAARHWANLYSKSSPQVDTLSHDSERMPRDAEAMQRLFGGVQVEAGESMYVKNLRLPAGATGHHALREDADCASDVCPYFRPAQGRGRGRGFGGRRGRRERTPPPHDASKRHLAYAIGMIAGAFPDAAKARAQLEKLRWAVSLQQLGRHGPSGRKSAAEAGNRHDLGHPL